MNKITQNQYKFNYYLKYDFGKRQIGKKSMYY